MSPIQRIELKRLIVFGTVGSCNTLVCYALYAARMVELGTEPAPLTDLRT